MAGAAEAAAPMTDREDRFISCGVVPRTGECPHAARVRIFLIEILPISSLESLFEFFLRDELVTGGILRLRFQKARTSCFSFKINDGVIAGCRFGFRTKPPTSPMTSNIAICSSDIL